MQDTELEIALAREWREHVLAGLHLSTLLTSALCGGPYVIQSLTLPAHAVEDIRAISYAYWRSRIPVHLRYEWDARNPIR